MPEDGISLGFVQLEQIAWMAPKLHDPVTGEDAPPSVFSGRAEAQHERRLGDESFVDCGIAVCAVWD